MRWLFYLLLILALTAAQARAQADTPTNTPTGTPTYTFTPTPTPDRGSWGFNSWMTFPEGNPSWTGTNILDWEIGNTHGRTGAGALIVSTEGLESSVCYDNDIDATTTLAVRACYEITTADPVTLAPGERATVILIDQDNEVGCFVQDVAVSETAHVWEVYYLGKETDPVFVESAPAQHSDWGCLELQQENIAGGVSDDTVFCSLRYNGRDVIMNVSTTLAGDCSGTLCDIKGFCFGAQEDEDDIQIRVDDITWEPDKGEWPIGDGYLFASFPNDGNDPDTDDDWSTAGCSSKASGNEHDCVDIWASAPAQADCLTGNEDGMLVKDTGHTQSHTVGHQDITLATVGGTLETIKTVYVTTQCCNTHSGTGSEAATRVRSNTSVSNLPGGSGMAIASKSTVLFRESFTTDPDTSAAWGQSGFNSAGFGMIKDPDGSTVGGRVRCPAWMAEVDVSTPPPAIDKTFSQDVDGDGETTLLAGCDSSFGGTYMGSCVGGDDDGCTVTCTQDADCGTGAGCVNGTCYLACEMSSECTCSTDATCNNIRQPGYQLASRMEEWDNVITCARNGMTSAWWAMVLTDVPNPSPTPDTGKSILDDPTILGVTCQAIKGGIGVCVTGGAKCKTAAECAACPGGFTPIKADMLLNLCGANNIMRVDDAAGCQRYPSGYVMGQPNTGCPEAATTPGPYECARVQCDNKDCDDIPCTTDIDCGPVGCDPGVECDCDTVTTDKCSTCGWVAKPPWEGQDNYEENAFCASSAGVGVPGSVCAGYCAGHQDPVWSCRGKKDCGNCDEDSSARCGSRKLCTGGGVAPKPCDDDSDCSGGNICWDNVAQGGPTTDHPCINCPMLACNMEPTPAAVEYCTCPCSAITCTKDSDCDGAGTYGVCDTTGKCAKCGGGGFPGELMTDRDKQRSYYRRLRLSQSGLIAFWADLVLINAEAASRGITSIWVPYLVAAQMAEDPRSAPSHMREQSRLLLRDYEYTVEQQHWANLNCSWQGDWVSSLVSTCGADDYHFSLAGAAAFGEMVSAAMEAMFPACSGDRSVTCASCDVPCSQDSHCDATGFGATTGALCDTGLGLCKCAADSDCGDGLTCEIIDGSGNKRCVGWDQQSCPIGDQTAPRWFKAKDQVCTDAAAGTCSDFGAIPGCVANPGRRCDDDRDCDGYEAGDLCVGGFGRKWLPCVNDEDCTIDGGPFDDPICGHSAVTGASPTPVMQYCRQPTATPTPTPTTTPTNTP